MNDVLVVGGGPAGAVYARELAGQGFQVLLLESAEPSRYKPCAGGISPAAARITPVPPEIVEREIGAARIVAPDGTAVTFSPKSAVGQLAAAVLARNLAADTLGEQHLAAYDRRWKRDIHAFNTRFSKKASQVFFSYPYADELVNAIVAEINSQPRLQAGLSEAVGWFFGGMPFLEIQLRLLRHPSLALGVARRLGAKCTALAGPIVRSYARDW